MSTFNLKKKKKKEKVCACKQSFAVLVKLPVMQSGLRLIPYKKHLRVKC